MIRSHARSIGSTQSLCPDCRSVVPAEIIEREGRVYFRKRCDEHGEREDFVCSDVTRYDQMQYSVPAKPPGMFGTEVHGGCPTDCGLCPEHEQHTCIGLVELTSSCNLACPMCYAGSGPGGQHLSLSQCKSAIDLLVRAERHAEVLQLSGGEPTLHPQFEDVLQYAVDQPIDYVMINTNGVRLANDDAMLKALARHKHRVEVYLQFDGLSEMPYLALRGEPLLETKLRAVERLGQAGVHITLVSTLQAGVNESELGPIVDFAAERPWIGGVSFQPATYSGRHVLPSELESRLTFPDVIDRIALQTGGKVRAEDFFPLPCAHPNCHSIAYSYREGSDVFPLTRFVDAMQHLDLLANGIAFQRGGARDLIERLLGRLGCCSGGCGPGDHGGDSLLPVIAPEEPTSVAGALAVIPESYRSAAARFFEKALAQQLGTSDLFRIIITSFLDVHNFDVRRVRKCCTHHLLPSGHIIPFCAYNVLYRDGHMPLPPLSESRVGQAMG